MSSETPSQTIGPFFGPALCFSEGPYVVPEGTPGSFWIRGRVLDGEDNPVTDALIETWQPDPDGRFAHPDDPKGAVAWDGFRGFARSPSDADGAFAILTVKPGSILGPDGRPEAPHLAVSVFARGLLGRLVTRIYFGDETQANAADGVLGSLPDYRRNTLIAVARGADYRFDIRLQGRQETVFFDV